jgi:hypothetical protein
MKKMDSVYYYADYYVLNVVLRRAEREVRAVKRQGEMWSSFTGYLWYLRYV